MSNCEQSAASLIEAERFRAALCRAPVVLFTQDAELRYTWVYNSPFASAADLLGKTDDDLLPPSSAAALKEVKMAVLRSGVGMRREVRLELPVGVKHYDVTVEPIRDPEGRTTGVACTALDITDRVEAEAARRDGEERLRLAQEAAGIGIHDYNPATGQIRWDARVRELWGVGPDEPVTFDLFLAGLHPDDRGPTQAAVDRALDPAGDRHYHAEYRVVSRRDGVERWVVATGNTTFIDGKAVRLVGTVHDVTAQKRAEAALRASEERFRLAADAVNGIIYDYDPQSGRVERTRGLSEVLGYRPDDVPPTAEWWWDQIHPDDRSALGRLAATAVPDRTAAGYRVRHQDGRWLHVEERAVTLRDAAGEPVRVVGCTVDVTDRERAEAALRASEERFRSLANATPAIIWTADPAGRITFHNQRWLDYTGIDPAENVQDWPRLVLHPDDYQRCTAAWQAALRAGTDYEIEVRNRRRDGAYRWFLTRATPIRDAAGRVVEWYGSTTDIHDRKVAEEVLRDADRKKDEFLATLAHELRNPLAPIRNAVQVLTAKVMADPALARVGEMIDRQVRVMARLLDDLLDVSRITRGKLELRRGRVELAAVVASAVETSRPLLDAAGHELTVDLPAEPVVLDADPVRLAQVFANLLNNAAKYTDRGGHIRLAAVLSQGGVTVGVSDDGIGIAPDMLPRLFEIFSQADPALERAQGGLGIGLSLVRGLVELHGGTVEARSAGPGRGSTFTVRLPSVVRAAPRPSAKVTQPGGRSKCRLLIADDLRDNADSTTLLLQLRGHEVRTAYDGEQALAVAAEFRPDVVLLDLGMPKLSGFEVCRRIRQQPWGRRMYLVAVTGWGQEDDRRRTAEAGFDRHLVKPVEPAELDELLVDLAAHPRDFTG